MADWDVLSEEPLTVSKAVASSDPWSVVGETSGDGASRDWDVVSENGRSPKNAFRAEADRRSEAEKARLQTDKALLPQLAEDNTLPNPNAPEEGYFAGLKKDLQNIVPGLKQVAGGFLAAGA